MGRVQNAVVVNPHTGDCDFSAPFNSSFPFVGTVTVSEDCSAEMVMDFAPAPFVSTFHLQLSRDRQSFVGLAPRIASRAFGRGGILTSA